MPKDVNEQLIQLVLSLSKAEKRSFRLFVNRNPSSEHSKFMTLFDYIEKHQTYSDDLILKFDARLSKQQLPNLKAHLQKQILSSLRLQHSDHFPMIEVRELMDHAQIFYYKGFIQQALATLGKAKNLAYKMQSNVNLLAILDFEKRIESQHFTNSGSQKAEDLAKELETVESNLHTSSELSNLALQLYAMYIRIGFVRNEKDFLFMKEFFDARIPKINAQNLDFESKLHLYTAYVWYSYIVQDFMNSFKYASLWVRLFEQNQDSKLWHHEMYLRGVYHLQNALFNLRSYKRLENSMALLEQAKPIDRQTQNNMMLFELYQLLAEINLKYLSGKFSEGLVLAEKSDDFLKRYKNQIDKHRIMLLNYKIACLYFGAGENRSCIRFLNKIIHQKDTQYKEDIQCFARILNLIAHYELGNEDLVEYQVKSVYRFLIKMNDMQGVQKEIIQFIRKLPNQQEGKILVNFKTLLNKLTALTKVPYETRPFLYLDIISWLESKIERVSVQEVIYRKFQTEQNTGKSQYFPQ